MRLPTLVIAFCCPLAASAATVDLDAPGALDALERSKPSHYARVVKLVSAAQRAPCEGDDVRRMQVAAAARNVECSMIIQTSLPPKQRMTFTLEGAVYTKVIVLHYVAHPVR